MVVGIPLELEDRGLLRIAWNIVLLEICLEGCPVGEEVSLGFSLGPHNAIGMGGSMPEFKIS